MEKTSFKIKKNTTKLCILIDFLAFDALVDRYVFFYIIKNLTCLLKKNVHLTTLRQTFSFFWVRLSYKYFVVL